MCLLECGSDTVRASSRPDGGHCRISAWSVVYTRPLCGALPALCGPATSQRRRHVRRSNMARARAPREGPRPSGIVGAPHARADNARIFRPHLCDQLVLETPSRRHHAPISRWRPKRSSSSSSIAGWAAAAESVQRLTLPPGAGAPCGAQAAAAASVGGTTRRSRPRRDSRCRCPCSRFQSRGNPCRSVRVGLGLRCSRGCGCSCSCGCNFTPMCSSRPNRSTRPRRGSACGSRGRRRRRSSSRRRRSRRRRSSLLPQDLHPHGDPGEQHGARALLATQANLPAHVLSDDCPHDGQREAG
mmetsp:Transcript_19191/g.73426  ORF Transcript_19191/g.73426 Transcript_19191/m.73426 type:complete len:300 (+) Transcript_19191:3066-3965(+)